MALVTKLSRRTLSATAKHSLVECTYDVVTDADGTKYLQLDTYGSKERKLFGKKSQSLRFAPAAIAHLRSIFAEYQL